MDSKNISDVFCPSCGAPANFDIIHQNYKCSHCDGRVEISEAVKEKQGFRELHQNKIKESVGNYKLCSASCKNCGATVVFEENESMTTCAFCGTAMVRNEYAGDKELPELIIPFRITEDEAKKIAKEWCKTNNNKIEAKHFSEKIDQMKGFYLPYELVRGSVSGKASRKDSETTYDYRGNVAKEFINGSNQLNNLLLDAMEPFDLTDLAEFDFGYVAGQRVKIKDVNDQEIKQRMLAELEANYKTDMQNTFHTNVLDVSVDAENILRMPVLLPVYYIRDGEFMAAINGQTGKVSVRAEEDSYNYFFPWWGKAFLFTVILSFLADRYILCDAYSGDKLNGARFLIIVFFACISSYYFNLKKNPFKVLADRKIFTSKGGPYIRNANNNLVMSNEKLARTTIPPIFFKKIDDRIQPVELDFSSALKRMLAIAIVPAFLPIILALPLNGFNFSQLKLFGAAIWWFTFGCVPLIWFFKNGMVELYSHPLVYLIDEDGKKKRYVSKDNEKNNDKFKGLIKKGLLPPGCLVTCLILFILFVSVAMTANLDAKKDGEQTARIAQIESASKASNQKKEAEKTNNLTPPVETAAKIADNQGIRTILAPLKQEKIIIQNNSTKEYVTFLNSKNKENYVLMHFISDNNSDWNIFSVNADNEDRVYSLAKKGNDKNEFIARIHKTDAGFEASDQEGNVIWNIDSIDNKYVLKKGKINEVAYSLRKLKRDDAKICNCYMLMDSSDATKSISLIDKEKKLGVVSTKKEQLYRIYSVKINNDKEPALAFPNIFIIDEMSFNLRCVIALELSQLE